MIMKKKPNVDKPLTTAVDYDALGRNKNYLSLRDFIIYNAINVKSVEKYFQILNKLIIDYQSFITLNDDIDENDEVDLIKAFKTTNSDKKL